MACYISHQNSVSLPPHKRIIHTRSFKPVKIIRVLQKPSISDGGLPYNTLVSEAVRLLVPPANFEASKLKVLYLGEAVKRNSEAVIPRTYILSHCDFTANLTLSVSNVINLDQLDGWYKKDDVVAEWKKVRDEIRLHVHCCVSGPNFLQDVAAEFRYSIFSKELPLVLQAVLHGDAMLFRENPELRDAYVWVYFHSSSPKYNRIECWGPLKDAAKGKQKGILEGFLAVNKNNTRAVSKWKRPKSFLQALFTFFL